MRIKVLALFLFLLIVGPMRPARAQSPVGRIIIQNIVTDPESFPIVTIDGLVLNSEDVPVLNLSADMFSITENGQPVQFDAIQADSGTRTSIVLDMGKWINNFTVSSRERVKDKMQNLALRFVDRMKPDDQAEIIVVYGLDPIVMLSFTKDKGILRDTIKGLNWNNDQESYGLGGIIKAKSELVDSSDDLFKRILFISPGIMLADQFSETDEEVVQDLLAENITLYAVHVIWQQKYDYYHRFEFMTNESKGAFFTHVIEADLDSLFHLLDSNRTVYRFTYRSVTGTATDRTVTLSYLGSSDVSDTRVYTVDSSLVSPANIQILVNNGEPILLLAENPIVTVPVHIILDGLGTREIKNIALRVNGQEYGSLSQTAPGTFSTNWQLSNELVSQGDSQLLLEVVAEDELGVVHQSSAAVTVRLQAPVDPLCRALSNIPGLGEACVNSKFTLAGLTNIVLFLLVLGLGGVVWIKRDTVAKTSKQIGARITRAVERITNRLRRSEPKARLLAIKGIPEGTRMEFDLFGETPIGSSNENASLVFDNPNISRWHCTIHEGHAGNWTIEDLESTNGTFVNSQKLTRFVEKELESGDIIELAPLEYGGIKFRFEILEIFPSDPIQPHSEENEVSSFEKQGATRKTKRFGSAEGEPEEVIDPSDPANQKW